MAATKCNKCGAIIPDGASFCPGCGAPKGEEKPAATATVQQQAPPPQPTYVQRTSSNMNIMNIYEKIFSKTMLLLGVSLGVLLIWIGNIIATYSDDSGGLKLGIVVNTLGFAILGIILIGGAITNKALDKNVRTGMIISGAIMLGMSMALSLSSIFAALSQVSSFGF